MFKNKYYKYKTKYFNLKKQIGGMLSNTTKISPLEEKDYDLSNIKLIGSGGYGIVGIIPYQTTFLAIKLIKGTHVCSSAKDESTIHNNVYCAFKELEDSLKDTSYKYLYIPKPMSFKNYDVPKTLTFANSDFESQMISCSYAMEYMIPINIKKNIYENNPIQIHISASLNEGFIKNSEYRGYMIHSIFQLHNLLKLLNDENPKIKKPQSIFDVIEAIGIAVGCAIFSSKYNPKDFQFMLSEFNGEYKIIGFDFGLFEKIENFDSITMNQIFDDIIMSPYLGMFMSGYENSFLNGISLVVKQFVKLYGKDCKEFNGFKILVDLFTKEITSIMNETLKIN